MPSSHSSKHPQDTHYKGVKFSGFEGPAKSAWLTSFYFCYANNLSSSNLVTAKLRVFVFNFVQYLILTQKIVKVILYFFSFFVVSRRRRKNDHGVVNNFMIMFFTQRRQSIIIQKISEDDRAGDNKNKIHTLYLMIMLSVRGPWVKALIVPSLSTSPLLHWPLYQRFAG